MPNFFDYIFAPWKALLLLSGGSSVEVTASAGQLPAGALCGLKDLGGGQSENVCRFFGYEMPFFIFFASALIFGLFVFASVSLFRQCTQMSESIERLAQQLQNIKPQGETASAAQLDAVRTLVQKHPAARYAWNQYEETLLNLEGSEIYSTQSADSVFSSAALLRGNVQSELFNAIPGVLTGLGLLMTFIAILDGLSHVSVSSTMDVQGIGGLINGLSGKFVSSIVAIFCAVGFVFVERAAYARTGQAQRTLVERLSGLFKRKTTEHLLLQLLKSRS